MRQGIQKEGYSETVLPRKRSARGVDTGIRSGQNAVTRGQWQLALGNEGAPIGHHSGEAKSNPAVL